MASSQRFLAASHYQTVADGFYRYDPELWLPTLRFSMTPFMLPPWALISATSFAMTFYVEVISPSMRETFSLDPTGAVVLGSALSFLVVFRTNAAFDRWFTARCAWSNIVGTCRTIAAMSDQALSDLEYQRTLIGQLMAFAVALKSHLRDTPTTREELGVLLHSQPSLSPRNAEQACPPMTALAAMSRTIRNGVGFESKPGAAETYGVLLGKVAELAAAVCTCELIKTTPMTFGYVATVRTFMLLWIATLPLVMVGPLGWFAPAAVSLIAYLFINIEQMAMEIEQPFGLDANDLPLEVYCLDIEGYLLEVLPSVLTANQPAPPPEVVPSDGAAGGELLLPTSLCRAWVRSPKFVKEPNFAPGANDYARAAAAKCSEKLSALQLEPQRLAASAPNAARRELETQLSALPLGRLGGEAGSERLLRPETLLPEAGHSTSLPRPGVARRGETAPLACSADEPPSALATYNSYQKSRRHRLATRRGVGGRLLGHTQSERQLDRAPLIETPVVAATERVASSTDAAFMC